MILGFAFFPSINGVGFPAHSVKRERSIIESVNFKLNPATEL